MDAKQRLAKARKVLNLSQRAMSELLGIEEHKIKDREIGRVKINNMFAALLKEKLNINPDWLLYGKGNMFAKTADIPKEFYQRVKEDIEKRPEKLNKIKFKEKIEAFLQGYVMLSRKEVIELAQALKQPVDEYLDLSGYIPESILEISGGNRRLNILFRKMNELTPEDLDNVLKTLETVVDAYVAKYKKED